MHPCAALLNKAFIVAEVEEKALKDEDIEQAEQCAALRERLLEEAWDQRVGYDALVLIDQLSQMQLIQDRLEKKSAALYAKYRDELMIAKKQSPYRYQGMNGVGHKAYYCNKES